MIGANDLGREGLLQQTIFEQAEDLARQDLKLADYLRLLNVTDDMDGGGWIRIEAGWTRECQRDKWNDEQ